MADVTSTFAAKDVGFSATVNRMQRTLQGFQSGIAGFGMKVAGLAATFVSVQAAMSAFRNGLDMAGRLDDLSKTTGETAGNLATLERAFQNNGMQAEQVGVSIAKMSEFIIGLRSGSDAATKAASAMGISLADLAGKTPIQQMQAIMQAIAGIRDPALRTATAVDVFGRSGRAVVPLASEFSGEIANARAELGSLVPILDANAASLDQLGDKLQNAVGNKLNEVAIGFAAGITGANNFVDALAKIDAAGFGKQLGDSLRIAFDAPAEVAKGIGYTLLTGAKEAGNALINASKFAADSYRTMISSEDYIKGLGLRLRGTLELAANGFLRVIQEGAERLYRIFATLPGPFGAAARRDLEDIAAWQDSLNAKIAEANKKLSEGADLIRGSARDAVNSTEILAKDWLGVEQSAADAARHFLDAEQRSNTIRENADKTAESYGKGSAALRDALAEVRGFDLTPKSGPEERPDWFKSNQPPPKNVPAPGADTKGGRGGGTSASKPQTALQALQEAAKTDPNARAELMRLQNEQSKRMNRAGELRERGMFFSAAREELRAERQAERSAGRGMQRQMSMAMFGSRNLGDAVRNFERDAQAAGMRSKEALERMGVTPRVGESTRSAIERFLKDQTKSEMERKRQKDIDGDTTQTMPSPKDNTIGVLQRILDILTAPDGIHDRLPTRSIA